MDAGEVFVAMKFLLIFLTVLLSLPGQAAWPAEVVDQAGRRLTMPDHPARIVALAPSIVEIVFELGGDNLLVGATEFSDYPEAAKILPRVGSYVRLDVERIVALKPDLCLAIRDGNPEFAVKQLEAFGIPVYVIDPRNLNDIIDVVERYGRLLGADRRGKELSQAMRGRINAVRDRMARTTTRPLVFFQIDATPIISAGSATFIDDLITLAGGRNAASGANPYPHFNWEDILRMKPDVVMVASMAGGHSPRELVSTWQKWRELPAVKNNRLHVVDATLIDRPTPRLIDGLEVFAAIIHPEIQ